MLYTITSDTIENADGMRELTNLYQVEAMSAIDAIVRAAKQAGDDEEYITVETDDAVVCAYRLDGGAYEFHVTLDDGTDMPFTIPSENMKDEL